MAENIYSCRTGSFALTANATKSLWLLNPAGNQVTIVKMNVSFNGTDPTLGGIGVELVRATTIGSPAGTTGTLIKRDPNLATAGATVLTQLSTEPTTYEVLDEWFITPNAGLLDMPQILGREPIAVAAGSRVGLRYTTPASVSPNARACVWWAE